MKKLWVLLLCFPFFVCCQSTKLLQEKDAKIESNSTASTAEKKAILLKNMAAFSDALMRQDYDFVVNAYTEDAKIFPNNLKILAGHEAIRNYWTPPAGSNSRTTYHKITPEEIKIIGNEAYDYGYYEGKSIGNDGKEYSWKGKYVITWKEVAPDVWKMYLDIWNGVRD